MINKFQQGGKQQDAIMQFVQGLAQVLQVKPEQVIQVAQQNPKALESAVQVYQQTQDMNQAAQAFTQSIQKARQGAKLQYLKSLKRQCADDEELYYYKKGGSVGCGCKKKEDGGQVAKAQKGTVVDKFKNRKQDQASRDSLRINSMKGDDELEATRPGNYKPNPKHNPKDPNSRTHIWVPDRTKEPYKKVNKKDCGGAVKKFKKHRQGGSLNGISFYQDRTNKGKIKL